MLSAVSPPSRLTWGQTMVEVMKIMVSSFKRSYACTAPSRSAPDFSAGYRQPTSPPEAPGHSQASLLQFLVGSLPLSPWSWCTPGFVYALQESVSTVLCQFSWHYDGVNDNLFQRAYATHRSAVPRAPVPAAGHCWRSPPQETLKHSKADLAQSLWGLLVHIRFCLSPPSISGG